MTNIQQTKQNTPTLRFPEFSGEWEKKKLGEVAKFRRGSFPQPYGLSKWYDEVNGVPFVQVFDVDDNMKLKNKTKQKISLVAQPMSVFMEKGSIVLTIQGSIGRIAMTQYDAYVDRTLLIFQSFNLPIDKLFFIHVVYLLFELEKQKAPGGTIKTITKEVLTNFQINLPSLLEQQKIASFLTAVDGRIGLMQKKLALLKKYKKGVMQKIFSQQIRFKDENGKDYPGWEEKKLGDLLNVSMGQSPDSEAYNINSEGLYLIQGNADIKDRKTEPRFWTSQITKICEVGDIILTVRAPSGLVAISQHKACIGRGVASIKPKHTTTRDFIYQFLLWFEPKWVSIEQGSTFTAISGDDIRSIRLKVPSLNEQQKIAEFLSSIDDIISLTERKLEEAAKFKKSLLQQMFI